MPAPFDPKRPVPLDYEQPPRKKRGLTAIICIVAAIYGIAAFFIARIPDAALPILEMATIPAAVIAGIYFGTQDKEYWL